jgi:hypothetical protein
MHLLGGINLKFDMWQVCQLAEEETLFDTELYFK